MASIEEVGKETKKKMEKIFDTIKDKFQEKPVFYTALICVVIFALYKLFNSSDDQYAEEEVVTNAYVPVGYDGYPYMSESMLEDLENMYGGSGTGTGTGVTGGGTTSSGTVNGESSSYVEDSYIFDTSYTENLEQYNKELLQQMGILEEQMWTMEQDRLLNELTYTDEGEVYNGLGDLIYSKDYAYKVLFPGDPGYETQMALETANNKTWRSEQLRQMQANSAAWSKATTTAEKNALHQANQEIAKGLGLTYNSGTGKWYEADGSEALIYSGTTKTSTSSTKTSTTGSSSYGGVSYDKNTDYAALINKAKASGASQSEIDRLTAQREAKKAGEGLDDYGNKVVNSAKTSSSSSSKSSSSSSSKSSSSSSSSSSTPKQGTVTGKVTWSKTKNSDGSTTHTATGSDGKVKASYTTK